MSHKYKSITGFVVLALLVAPVFISPGAYASSHDPLLNPSFEQEGATPDTAFDWQHFGSGYTRVQKPHSGSWGIELKNTDSSQQSGAFQRIDLDQEEVKPVFIGGYVSGQNIVNAPGGNFGASIYAEIHLNDGSIVYWNSVPNFGTFSWRWVGFNTGSPMAVSQTSSIIIDKPIDYIFVVPILGNAKGTAWFDDITVTEFTPYQSAITLMFDDGEANVYAEARPVLDSHGFVGSTAVIARNVNLPGFLGIRELRDLQTSGWEIVSHGLSHTDLTTLHPLRAQLELMSSKRILERLGLTVNNFAFPFGAYNAHLIAEGTKWYSSLRAFELGDNPQGTFPYDVKVRSVVETTSVDEVASWVTKAKNENRWVVIVFHTINEIGDDAFHVDPETFRQMIGVVAESNVPVVTYEEGIRLFGVTP